MVEIKYEREGGAPEDWETDVILLRNTFGKVIKVDVPDDDTSAEEVKNDAGDD